MLHLVSVQVRRPLIYEEDLYPSLLESCLKRSIILPMCAKWNHDSAHSDKVQKPDQGAADLISAGAILQKDRVTEKRNAIYPSDLQ